MAIRMPEAPAHHVVEPRLRGHRLHCPRCEARLMSEGDDYVCLACGYVFPAEHLARDVQRALERRSRPHELVMGLGPAIVAGSLLARGLGGLTWFGALVGVGVGAALLVAMAVARRARA